MKKTDFMGWKNCVEIASGKSRLVVTTAVGPRIIGGFIGKSRNLFYVDEKTAGKTGDDNWKIYGGHRIWHSPEARPRTYAPDNSTVEFKKTKDGFFFSSGVEKTTGVRKSFTIRPLGGNKFEIEHRLSNENLWDIEIAAWALSVMAPGGVAVAPLPQGDKKSLLPNRFISVWPYSNMADKRFTWGDRHVLLRQDEQASGPCKFGLNCEDGWLAYVNNGAALVKTFAHMADAEYPDNGCSVEVYSCPFMLEIETLSPLFLLGPGEELTHVETFHLFDSLPEINGDKDAEKVLGKLAR